MAFSRNESVALESPGPGGSLQWKEHPSGHWSAKGLGGRYDIYPRGAGGYTAYWEQSGTGSQHELGSYDTIGAAFGACRRHADGERRQTAAAEDGGVGADVARKAVASAYGGGEIDKVSGGGSHYTVILKSGKRLHVAVDGSTGTVTDPDDGHVVATHTVSEAAECDQCAHKHPKSVPTKPCSDESALIGTIRGEANPAGFTFVPNVVRKMVEATGLPVKVVHAAILKAERDGFISLYSNDGFGRLSPSEKKLSIPGGPNGTYFAYVKMRPEYAVRETVPVIHEANDAGSFATMDRDTKEFERGKALGKANTPTKAYKLVRKALERESQEVFLVLPLDLHGELLSRPVEVARGQRDQVKVGPSDVLRPVIQYNAKGFVVIHNHPSGHASPSTKDGDLTETIRKDTPSDVTFLDHLVVGTKEFYSFTENKLYKVR